MKMVQDPELVIIRGVSGSGKTTLAKTHYGTHAHYESDMYFMKNGEYLFDEKKLRDAHTWCKAMVMKSLDDGFNTVVSNTFTRLWEFQPYLEMTSNVHVIVCQGKFKSIHGLNSSTISKQRERFEAYEGEFYYR